MDPRESLRQRSDVSNADIEQIIEVAAGLQDADQAASARPTIAELEAVASELDIQPEYVDKAINQLRDEREAAAEAAREASVARAGRRSVAAVVGAAGLLFLLGLVGIGASSLTSQRAAEDAAERALVVVLDRQAGLAPQLTAMAGSSVDLSAEVAAVRDAEGVDARMTAVEALNTKMAAALAVLPETTTESTRLDLRHEITGGWNRITVERRRLEEVRAQAPSSSRPDVMLARLLGF